MKRQSSTLWKRRILPTLCLSLFFGFSVFSQTNLTSDSLALVALYNSTDGPNWNTNTNWNTAQPLSSWHGVYVFNGRVSRIVLYNNNLTGPIPPEFGDLKLLRTLILNNNNINGVLPDAFGGLETMTDFYITNNDLTGPLPSSVGQLNSLITAYMGSNQITGSIPREFGDLAKLNLLSMPNNQFTGSIPPEIGRAISLQSLELQNNNLSGTIPVEVFDPPNFKQLNLKNNQIVGPLPADIGRAESLEGLYLTNNFINGGIPPSIGDCDQLKVVHLNNNNINESLPIELGDMDNLQVLYLENNEIPGAIPPDLANPGNLPALFELLLQNNDLEGEIPSTIGNLSSLKILQLENNNLSGELPANIGSLNQLQYLTVQNNQISGNVPSQLADATTLIYLSLENNEIENLPDLTPLTNLNSCSVYNNRLTFEDLEPNVGLAPVFTYSPQPKVHEVLVLSTTLGNDETLSAEIGGSNNVYQWILNGVDIPGAINATLTLQNIEQSSLGTYECRIINKDVEGLTLMRHPVIVTLDFDLPIELISFKATPVGQNAVIDWITEMEENNDYFVLERSKDGIDFEPLTTINGQGNSQSRHHYEYIDEVPLFGVSYYRLAQYDFDGSSTYSRIVSVEFDKFFINQVSPNPVKVNGTIKLRGQFEGLIRITMVDITGRTVYDGSFPNASSTKSLEFTPERVLPGTYMILINSGINRITRKVVLY